MSGREREPSGHPAHERLACTRGPGAASALDIVGAVQGSEPAPPSGTVLIYRDFLLPASETFIVSQASALERHRPLLVGRRRVAGLDLAGLDWLTVNRDGPLGRARETLHRLGLTPPATVRAIRSRGPQLMHAHFGPDGLNALPLKRRLGIPLIVTFHGYDAYQGAEDAAAGHRRYLKRRLMLNDHADCIVAVTRHMERHLISLGFSEHKIRQHYIGIDTSKFTPGGVADREPTVVAVGRLVEKKGFADLIQAMPAVRESLPAARLVLIGAGPLEPELRELAHNVGPGVVELLGHQPPAEVAHWMQRARVVAVPSVTARSGDSEGTTMTVLEGMASGLPAVGTRHGGIPEVVLDGETGYLVDEHDPGGLARGIIAVLEDESRWERLSTQARAHVERHFDLHRQTRRLEEIYDSVLHGRSSRVR
jgi:colanic acid/amylovoran biosynthesis glycosyltransferase